MEETPAAPPAAGDTETMKKLIEESTKKAQETMDKIIEEAEQKARSLLSEAHKASLGILGEAEKTAGNVMKESKVKAEKLVGDTINNLKERESFLGGEKEKVKEAMKMVEADSLNLIAKASNDSEVLIRKAREEVGKLSERASQEARGLVEEAQEKKRTLLSTIEEETRREYKSALGEPAGNKDQGEIIKEILENIRKTSESTAEKVEKIVDQAYKASQNSIKEIERRFPEEMENSLKNSKAILEEVAKKGTEGIYKSIEETNKEISRLTKEGGDVTSAALQKTGQVVQENIGKVGDSVGNETKSVVNLLGNNIRYIINTTTGALEDKIKEGINEGYKVAKEQLEQSKEPIKNLGILMVAGNLPLALEGAKTALRENQALEAATSHLKQSLDYTLENLDKTDTLVNFNKRMREASEEAYLLGDEKATKSPDPIQNQWNKEILRWQTDQAALSLLDRELTKTQKELKLEKDPTKISILKKKRGAIQTQQALYEKILQERHSLLEGKGAMYDTPLNTSNRSFDILETKGGGEALTREGVQPNALITAGGVGDLVNKVVPTIQAHWLGTDLKSIQRGFLLYGGDLKTLEEHQKNIEKIYEDHAVTLERTGQRVQKFQKKNNTLKAWTLQKIGEKEQEETEKEKRREKDNTLEKLQEGLKEIKAREAILEYHATSPVKKASGQTTQGRPLTVALKGPDDIKESLSQEKYVRASRFQEMKDISPENKKDYKRARKEASQLVIEHAENLKSLQEKDPKKPLKAPTGYQLTKQLVFSLSPWYQVPDHMKVKEGNKPSLATAEIEKLTSSNLPPHKVIRKMEKMTSKLEERNVEIEQQKKEHNPRSLAYKSRTAEQDYNNDVITQNKNFSKKTSIQEYKEKRQNSTQERGEDQRIKRSKAL